MKILIKGAGDLATGIAYRLWEAGHQIVMTEIEKPLTVRRSVAMSEAVYKGSALVEGMRGILVHDEREISRELLEGNIAVIVDANADIRESFRPDVVVDAIMAKKNLGTSIDEAAFVAGIGPGFTASKDCHCVIETKRGDTLGTVIWAGSALPNTGIPGDVEGYTAERLLKASADGTMEPRAAIGERVEKGQIVAVTGSVPVYAQMTGMIRGMLKAQIEVAKGMKIGDIDARCDEKYCRTISDKAKCVGEGVARAIDEWFKHQAIVVLAAGSSKRFGENKLLFPLEGKPLYRHMMDNLKAIPCAFKIIVTGDKRIEDEALEEGITIVQNTRPELGISHSMKLGLLSALKAYPGVQRILFTVCDQPGLTDATMRRLLDRAAEHQGKIVCVSFEGQPHNPVVWDRIYFDELMKLTGDAGGRQIMNKYKENIVMVETDKKELQDVDRKTDLER